MTARLSYASLSNENQRLRLELHNGNVARQSADRLISDLQHRLQLAESAVDQQLREKEADWMNEYDRNVQALLQIIKHHERERDRLMAEILRLREKVAMTPPAVVKVSRSTQTQIPPRTSSVRFLRDEIRPGMEKKSSTGSKVKLDKMQRLFEQLQNSNGNERLKRCELKISVIDRLTSGKAEAAEDAHQRREGALAEIKSTSDEFAKINSANVNVSTSAPKQVSASSDNSTRISSSTQQGLEECNRLLVVRLESQQQILDQLLNTKFHHTGAVAEKLELDRFQSITSSPAKDCVAGDINLDLRQEDLEFGVHTTDNLVASTQEEEATRNTRVRRPQSPPAA